ncbi:Peptidase S16 [uncultured Gammaproteobacteria bacterium]
MGSGTCTSPTAVAESVGQLPTVLPIFPLVGVVLLPRGLLPLHIFEPRYVAMIGDALAGERMIGMIQPNCLTVSGAGRAPLYPIGCAGRISAFAEVDDDRYLITLTGVCRFTFEQELSHVSGYRRVVPMWQGYDEDLAEAPQADINRQRLFTLLHSYFEAKEITPNWEAMESSPDDRLITALAMVCPFEANEKQALLEAQTLIERARILLTMVEMAVQSGDDARQIMH